MAEVAQGPLLWRGLYSCNPEALNPGRSWASAQMCGPLAAWPAFLPSCLARPAAPRQQRSLRAVGELELEPTFNRYAN